MLLKNNKYNFIRARINNTHIASIFNIEILPGIKAYFGEPKSKLGSGWYHLIRLEIDANLYSASQASIFWCKFHIVFINNRKLNKKIPRIFKIINTSKKGVIAICEPSNPIRENLNKQNDISFWENTFYDKTNATVDSAIHMLIERIKLRPALIDDVAYQLSSNTVKGRVFEEIVAEIFKDLGCTVTLTKQTRDGGKDIIVINQCNELILIECKNHTKTIGVSVVRDVIGAAIGNKEKPHKVIVATTSYFSEDSMKYEIFHSDIVLELWDRDIVLEWISKYKQFINMSKEQIQTYIKLYIGI